MSDSNWTENVVTGDSQAPIQAVDTPSNPTQVIETAQEDEVTAPGLEAEAVESAESAETVSQREQLKSLVKRERELREQESKTTEIQNQITEFNKLKDSAKTNPMALLEHLGLSFDDLLGAQLGIEAEKPEPPSEMEQLREEIKALKEAKEQEKQAEEQARIDAAINNHKSDIATLLSTETDKYELINATGEQELVWEVTEQYYEAHQVILTPAEAAQMVEDHLTENYKTVLEKTTKFKPQLKNEPKQETEAAADIVESQPSEKPKDAPAKPSQFTLTNNGGTAAKAKTSTLDHEASKAKAASLLKWT